MVILVAINFRNYIGFHIYQINSLTYQICLGWITITIIKGKTVEFNLKKQPNGQGEKKFKNAFESAKIIWHKWPEEKPEKSGSYIVSYALPNQSQPFKISLVQYKKDPDIWLHRKQYYGKFNIIQYWTEIPKREN